MSTLYELANVYEKATGKWLGQFTKAEAAVGWMRQIGLVPAAHIVCKNRPKDGKFPEGEDVLPA
jgi:hypothetical protein